MRSQPQTRPVLQVSCHTTRRSLRRQRSRSVTSCGAPSSYPEGNPLRSAQRSPRVPPGNTPGHDSCIGQALEATPPILWNSPSSFHSLARWRSRWWCLPFEVSLPAADPAAETFTRGSRCRALAFRVRRADRSSHRIPGTDRAGAPCGSPVRSRPCAIRRWLLR